MADKDDGFDMKQLYTDAQVDQLKKEEKQADKAKAEFESAQSEQGQEDKQGEDQQTGDAVATPLPEPRPWGEMSADGSEVMRQNQEAAQRDKINQHLELESKKLENRQNENERGSMSQDIDNSNER